MYGVVWIVGGEKKEGNKAPEDNANDIFRSAKQNTRNKSLRSDACTTTV